MWGFLHFYGVFFAASMILLATPGPAVIYVVSRSVEQGKAAGMASVAGITVGGFVHVFLAAFGLSALLAASATALNAVRLMGAGYLVYLGASKLLQKGEVEGQPRLTPKTSSELVREGIVVQILNPKIALFFLSFLPQFVVPGRGSPSLQFFGLGLAFVTLAFVTDSLFALAAGTIRERFPENPRTTVIQKWVSGLTFVALGFFAAFNGHFPGSS